MTDPWQPFDALGDELATLARAVDASERERRAIVFGLEAGLRRLGLAETVQVCILARLSPRVMTGLKRLPDPAPLQRLAV